MVLSEEFLEEVKYYTVTNSTSFAVGGIRTVFKFYFRKWHKFPKTLKIEWTCTRVGDDSNSYEEDDGAVELRRQLSEYFRNHNSKQQMI